MHTLWSRRAFLATALPAFTCLLTLAGCGGDTQLIRDLPVAVPASGIQGQVTRGPISPVAQAGQSNEAPLPGVVITARGQNGAEVARQTTDSSGNYKIVLPAGAYQVVGLAPNGSGSFPTPPAAQTVTVVAHQFATVNVSYDTGIR